MIEESDGKSKYLKKWMSIEFVEKIHNGVGMEGCAAQDDVFLIVCPVYAVRAA